jgi:response regulator RpfG family c-di-GMP phosphodiesterase
VNEGHVFRFLTKPCPSEVLVGTLRAGADQYRLVTSERVLLERTLLGCVKAMSDVLAITSPAAFGRAMRVKQYATMFAIREKVENRWQLEVAAMLSQIGSITLPPEVLDKVYLGKWLSDPEQGLVARLPMVATQILGDIPRLEPVVSMLVYQSKRYDGEGPPADSARGRGIPWGARVLKVLTDFDSLEARGLDPELALNTMRQRTGWYDPEILEAFARVRGIREAGTEVREIRLRDVRVGMTFAEDVVTRVGTILIARGQEVNAGLAERIRNIAGRVAVVEPVRVIVPTAAKGEPPAEWARSGRDARG